VVALLFALAEHLGHVQERKDANLGADSTALVSLTLSPPQRSGNRAGFSVRFRLSNRGNHSIFYPVCTETNIPIGQLVARTALPSDWTSLSNTSAQRLPAVQEDNDPNLRWIEMPPGGWADGSPILAIGQENTRTRFSSSRVGTPAWFGSCPSPMAPVGSSLNAKRFALRTRAVGVGREYSMSKTSRFGLLTWTYADRRVAPQWD
jgi:hypothetical protein